MKASGGNLSNRRRRTTMGKKMERYAARVRNISRKLCGRITKKPMIGSKFGGKVVLEQQAGNDRIQQLLSQKQPFMAGRFGSTELAVMRSVVAYQLGVRKNVHPEVVNRIYELSGFFPKDEQLTIRFSDLMCESCAKLDLIGTWFNLMEDYMIQHFAPQSEVTYLRAIEPWYHENPWSGALKGKKVLVIHPFKNTIERQFARRELLFPGTDILPEFDLQVIRAVQTLADQTDERFANWFEALDYMYEEAMKLDFEVAILGCGAYGFPLAARLKAAGRQAIHMGGATQLLFGIRGSRWDSHPVISKLYNENWVKPNEDEKPAGFKKVEEGCYW